MPVVTTASAISRISLSLTLQPNLFQLFQPMGGVAATAAAAWACDGCGVMAWVSARMKIDRNADNTRYDSRGVACGSTMIIQPPLLEVQIIKEFVQRELMHPESGAAAHGHQRPVARLRYAKTNLWYSRKTAILYN